ncbi:hypothetical protein PACTADRAFT_41197 [Pachysolen tannophilus NRRL Y-2460]|uniref:Kri1-like C-terminal domain-containing protein n=1 Tax=Pachysolen tannophilus NRRL Y-2460 TaxID=669874 RepID=A0A1E4TX30_PACTA|nr:hypothetical protein PACTADRAFT_41197 [Pachysolen tannophilus NRRL Y-2460]
MPRKKSAAKRAREEKVVETKEGQQVSLDKSAVEKNEGTNDDESFSSAEEDEDEEDEEEEDEYGDLITEEVEDGINKVLDAIRKGDKVLFDPKTRFFEDPEKAVENLQTAQKYKPIYLKDYHRMNVLSGGVLRNEEEQDGEKPFVVQQREERDQLLSEIKDAFKEQNDPDKENDDEEDDDDDGFLKKKAKPVSTAAHDETAKLPNPDKDEEKFLEAFLDSQAWIPKKGDKTMDLDGKMVIEEDDDEFEDAAEIFEHAYNFRYEDPNSAEIVSYARNQATLRRSKANSRKLQRQKQSEEKEKEQLKEKEKLEKKKVKKINLVTDRLKQIKEAVGSDVSDELITKVFGDSLLNEDFDDAEWDSKMNQIFDEAYYNAEVTKPEWEDDDEIMADFSKKDNLEDEEEEEIEEIKNNQQETQEISGLSKKDKLKDKKSKKKEKEISRKLAEKLVQKNTDKIIDELEKDEERNGRSKDREDIKFRYREVSPDSFGLTTREIILADDKDLNEFMGLKKFAPYKAKELRVKDRRKLTKKRRLKDWRKKVFEDEDGPKLDDNEEISIPIGEKTDLRDKKRRKLNK